MQNLSNNQYQVLCIILRYNEGNSSRDIDGSSIGNPYKSALISFYPSSNVREDVNDETLTRVI